MAKRSSCVAAAPQTPQVLQIAAEALFPAAVGHALDAKAQLMNHQAGWLQAVTTLLKPHNTLVSSRTFTPRASPSDG